MQQKGSSTEEVLVELKRVLKANQHYRDGKILCSMCTEPHPLAKRAYQMFFDSNLGDSGLFSGSASLEKEAINQLVNLLHGGNAAGWIVSGGTEANLTALWAARNQMQIRKPEVVLPQSAHFSFSKICNLLCIKPVYADLTDRFIVDTNDVERKITAQTIAIVGTAGTSELGAVDSIEKLSATASKNNIWLHVDAALGGLVIPFLEGSSQLPFDFELDGVKSLTVDPHKMGMAAIPAGGILFREQKLAEAVKTEAPYLTDAVQYTLLGTRSGASAASTWAVFKALGREGFKKVVEECIATTTSLAEELVEAGFCLIVEPTLNIVAFRSTASTKSLVQALTSRGYAISYVPRYDCIRIVIMPHIKKRHISNFMKALRDIENL